MAKKRANRREKAATRNAKSKADVRRKKLRRREGEIKRVELQLSADNPRDQYIAAHLNALEYGTTSEYVRCAIEEKIAREIAPAQPAQPALNADVMRAIVEDAIAAQFRGASLEQFQGQRITFGGEPPPAEVQSSGLDMGTRKRPKLARAEPAQIAAPEPEKLTEAESIRLGGLMAESVKKAQPGRIERRISAGR